MNPTEPMMMQQRRRRRVVFWWMAIGIVGLSLVINMVGNTRAPLEGHEVFVVSTAQQMLDSGDWLVPRYQEELRLTKPPMNYWLVAATGWLSGDAELTAWHGRTVSAVAGMGVAAITIAIGALMFGESIGLLAGLICITSRGFFVYGHNARPEMTYALCGAWMTWMFLLAWRRGSVWASYGMWAGFGLATLTKGPHIPAILIVGFTLTLAMHPPSRPRLMRIIRPITGLLLAAVMSVWWWVALYYRVGDALTHSQLAGSRYGLGWTHIFSPYYLINSWQWLLPWVVIWPLAIVSSLRGLRGGWRVGFGSRIMGLWLLVAVVILSFGGRKRGYYMLPMLPIASVWLALAARRAMTWLATLPGGAGAAVRSGLVLIAHAAAAIGFLVALWIVRRNDGGMRGMDPWLMAGGIGVVFALGILGWIARRGFGPRSPRRYQRELTAAALLFTMMYLFSGKAAAMWSPTRWGQAKMGELIQQHVPADVPVVTYQASAGTIAFYCQRVMHEAMALDELQSRTADAHAGHSSLAIVIPAPLRKSVAESIRPATLEPLGTAPDCDDDEAWSLYRVH